jgi:hypothetical protein
LRKQIHFAGGRVERPLKRDIKALLLSPRPVISEIETFFDESVDLDRPMLS